MNWSPISSAPFDRDLELAVIDHTGTHALLFPCLRSGHSGWINARTKRRVEVDPTHWREWTEAAGPSLPSEVSGGSPTFSVGHR
jgi:hypothetical protein